MNGLRAPISYGHGLTLRTAESTASSSGTDEAARTICAFIGRRVQRMNEWEITGTCSPKPTKLGRRYGKR